MINDNAIPLDDFPETYLSGRKREADKNKEYKVIFYEIIDMFKELKWQDIKFETLGSNSGTRIEMPVLPVLLRNKMKEAYRVNGAKAKANMADSTGRAFAKTWSGDELEERSNIYMKVEPSSGNQRSHFPNGGIPTSLRGTNLGYKLYRALLQKHKFLSSNTAGTTEKDYVWQSMISPKKDRAGALTEDDVHAIVGPDFVFAMIKTIPTAEKKEHAKNYIDTVVRGNSSRINNRNFAIDDELKALLPASVLAGLDPRQREAEEKRKAQARIAKYAPGGVDDHSFEIGDYIVVKSFLLQVDYRDLPVRKVVAKDGDKWIALKLSDLEVFERTGAMPDPRETTRKSEWVKSVLQPGMTDPTAGRIPRRGTSATVRAAAPAAKPTGAAATATADTVPEQGSRERRTIKNFMRNGYELFVKRSDWEGKNRSVPVIAYLVIRNGTNRDSTVSVMNARTAERQNLTRQAFIDAELIKLSQTTLTRKSDVRENDWVFIKDHRSFLGFIASVSRITPASNRQPGIYLRANTPRPLYVANPESLDKVLVVTEAVTYEGPKIKLFEDFKP